MCSYWEENLPDDYVPPADFDAPVSASDNGKDSSATAVVSSALLEIFVLTGEKMSCCYCAVFCVECFACVLEVLLLC